MGVEITVSTSVANDKGKPAVRRGRKAIRSHMRNRAVGEATYGDGWAAEQVTRRLLKSFSSPLGKSEESELIDSASPIRRR